MYNKLASAFLLLAIVNLSFAGQVDPEFTGQSIELIPHLINMYHKEKNIQKKLKILSSLTDLAQVEDLKKLDRKTIYRINQVQALFVDILHSEKNSMIQRKMITYSLGVLPMTKETYTLIVEVINKLDSDVNYRLDIEKKYFYLFAIGFANENMQKWLLPKLLIPSLNGKEKIALDNQLYFIIKELSPTDIEKDVRPLIEKFINASLSKVEDKNSIKFDEFYALATVTSNNVNERDNKLLNYALQIKKPTLQADYINKIDKATLLLLPAKEREALRKKYLQLFTQELNIQQKAIYASTFNQLGKTLK